MRRALRGTLLSQCHGRPEGTRPGVCLHRLYSCLGEQECPNIAVPPPQSLEGLQGEGRCGWHEDGAEAFAQVPSQDPGGVGVWIRRGSQHQPRL